MMLIIKRIMATISIEQHPSKRPSPSTTTNFDDNAPCKSQKTSTTTPSSNNNNTSNDESAVAAVAKKQKKKGGTVLSHQMLNHQKRNQSVMRLNQRGTATMTRKACAKRESGPHILLMLPKPLHIGGISMCLKCLST